jgi:type I restriction enzyme S subunit
MNSKWPRKRLGNCCEKIGSGATPKGGKDAYLDQGTIFLIRSQNIYNDGF